MRLVKIILSIALLVAGCKKSNVSIDSTRLQGKWKLTQVYVSDGSAAQWQAVPLKANYDYVQFNSNGGLKSTIYNPYQNYLLTDSITLTFSKADTLEHYHYTLQGGTLTLSPSGPVICFEGCGDRFVKVSD